MLERNGLLGELRDKRRILSVNVPLRHFVDPSELSLANL